MNTPFLIYVLLGLIIIKLAEGIYRLVLKLIEKKKEIKNSKVYFYKNKFYKVICVGVEIIVSIFVCLIGFLCVKNPKTVNLTYGDGENTLNIVAVSDVHYMTTGCVISLDDLVEDINELNPDVVFMLGDIVDVNVSTISYKDFASYMSEINSTYGVYLITGNHEFESNVDGNNKVDKTKVDRWFTKVENECDTFHYLTDEEVVIGNAIRVIGRLDYLYGGSSNSRVSLETIEKGSNLTDEEKNLPLIVLDHQPQDYAQALEFGATLQLSGHTHDAQLFPGNWILDILYKVKWNCIVHGNYHCDNFDLYITRGYGAWGFPMRTTGRSEILDIDFKY